ncbi:MAG TPA: RidA family protein [Alphaproteobacteria bacterium]|jgi:enamine deaminase RidA (YjgF/YER057c/UK114 family)
MSKAAEGVEKKRRVSRRNLVAGLAAAGAVAGVASTAAAQSAAKQTVRFVQPDTMVKTPSYTHVVEVIGPGKVIYTSGERGGDKNGKIPPDIKGQSWQALENIRLNLAAVGATFDNVVKINVYMMDLRRDHATWSEVKQTFVNKANPPASTTVQVAQLTRDGVLVEVDVVAVMPA